MINSSKVQSDLSSVMSAFNKYSTIVGDLNSAWKGNSHDNFDSKATSFSSEFSSAIKGQMSSFATACDYYAQYKTTKDNYNIAQQNYNMAVSAGKDASTFSSQMSSYQSEMNSLKQKIESALSSASSVKLEATPINPGVNSSGKVYEGVGEVSDYVPPNSNMKQYQIDFINSVANGAVKYCNEYGGMPSLVIAQAILESGWGGSSLGEKYNNLFGIKVGTDSGWTGGSVNLVTGEQDKGGNYYDTHADFRVYDSIEDSIKDHQMLFVNNPKRYGDVLKAQDYVEACEAIGKSGYATSHNYGDNLKGYIEMYDLNQYDPK